MRLCKLLFALPILLVGAFAVWPVLVMGSSAGNAVEIGTGQTSNIPYTLTRTSTIVQTLANGATITRTFTVKSARDSEGRTYSEEHLTTPVGLVRYTVFDSVARTDITWNNRTKIAIVTHIPAEGSEADTPQPPQIARRSSEVTREGLGQRTIAGLEARGTRITLIVPAGEVGNDHPFTIVTEDWKSTLYDIPLLTIHDDPRSGKRTDEVTEFHAGEPDPGLFRVPKGYTVEERTAVLTPLSGRNQSLATVSQQK